MKKRLLAVFLALTLLCTIVSGFASVQAEDEAAKNNYVVSILKNPSSDSVGDYSLYEQREPWGDMTATYEQINGRSFIMIDRKDGAHVGKAEDFYGVTIRNVNASSSNFVGIMIYIKTEKAQPLLLSPGEGNNNTAKIYNMNDSIPSWETVDSYSPSGADSWEQFIDIPDNFEGYVYHTFDTIGMDNINRYGVRFWTFGGEYGRVGLGNIYGVVSEPDETNQYFAGIEEVSGEIKFDVIKTPEKNASQYLNFISSAPWDVCNLSTQQVDEETLIKYTSKSNSGFVSASQLVGIVVDNLNISTSEYAGIAFYVKTVNVEKISIVDLGCDIKGIQLYDVNSANPIWQSSANSDMDYSAWRYWLNIPENFEGYIYASLADSSKETIQRMNVNLYKVGGQYGDFYLGGVYGVLSEPAVTDKVVLNRAHFLGVNIVEPAEDEETAYTVTGNGVEYALTEENSVKFIKVTGPENGTDENSSITIKTGEINTEETSGYLIRLNADSIGKMKFSSNGNNYSKAELLNIKGREPVWKTISADSNGYITVPDNFDGYVYLDFSSVSVSTPNALCVEFDRIGGAYGDVLIGQAGAIISKLEKIPSEIIDGEDAVKIIKMIDSIALTSLEQREEVEAVNTAYEALDIKVKPFITNYAKLVEYNEKIAAWDVVDKINGLGEITSYDQKSTVATLRGMYEKLSDNAKSLVTNYAALTAAEAKISELQQPITIGDCSVMLLGEATVGGIDSRWNLYEDGNLVRGQLRTESAQGFNGDYGDGYLTSITSKKKVNHFEDANNHLGVSTFELGVSSKDYMGVMIYIESGNGPTPANGTYLRLGIGEDDSQGEGLNYARLYDPAKGKWARYAYQTPIRSAPWENWIPTPKNFKGYLYIPFSDMNDLDENAVVDFLMMHMSTLGGDYGNFKIGAVYGVISATDKVDTVPVNIKMGEVYSELTPASTNGEKIKNVLVDGVNATFTWDAYEGATSYNVEIYQNYYTGANTAFQCYSISSAESTSTTVMYLGANMRYRALIRAMDGDSALAAYEAVSFETGNAAVLEYVAEEDKYYNEEFYGEIVEEETTTQSTLDSTNTEITEGNKETVQIKIPGKKGETKVVYVDVSIWELMAENIGLVIGIGAAVLVAIAGIIVLIVKKRRNKKNA